MKLHAYFQHYFLYKKVMKELEEKALEKILEQRRVKNRCREYKWYFLGI